MAKSIKDILNKYYINPTRPTKDPIYFGEDASSGELYPYKFAQNGTEDIVEYMDFGSDIIDTVKFLAPTAPFFKTLSQAEAFKDSEPTTREEDAREFSFEWTAMFDQLKTIPSDVKDSGGLFVFPNIDYFTKRLEDIEKTGETEQALTNVRREFSKVIRDCISHNYAETERLNKTLDDSKKIKLPDRSKGFMKKVAIAEGKVSNKGKGK